MAESKVYKKDGVWHVPVYGKIVKYKQKGNLFYRVNADGTLAKEATRNNLQVSRIKAALKPKKSEPSYMESLHASYYTPKKPKSKKEKSLTLLASLKKAKAAADAKKEKKPIVVKKEKSSNIKKGEAYASTLDGNKPIVVKKKEDKKPTVVKKKEKKTNFGVDTFDKAKVLKTRDVKALKTKKVPTVVEKKEEKPKTPKLKAFQGSYNKDTQKLVNIDGKTFVAPKSYEKPKSKTNPSFKKLMKKLGLRRGGHVDYRKTGLFR